MSAHGAKRAGKGVARRAETTSDVTRFRGVAAAALFAALATITAAIVFTSPEAMRGSPGSLSSSHQNAGLTCQQCHGAEPAASACEGCHGAHPSTRAPHQRLVRAGDLLCSSCHQIHSGDGRVVASVAILEASACVRCHDIDAPLDPIAACLAPGPTHASLGTARPTLCFDEHTLPGGARDAAWEAARQVAITSPLPPRPGRSQPGPWSWLGIGGIAYLVAFGAARTRLPLGRKKHRKHALVPARAPELLRLPTINTSTCLGCHACVDACPFDVLEIRRYVAVVARPEACCGLTLCEQRCPNGSLVMGDGKPAENAVSLDDGLQSTTAPGIYLAGDVTGLPLIRNAIHQGAHAVRALGAEPRSTGELDLVVVGAGPAGISAALEAKSLGLRYTVLEQATVAGSIQSFPRAKLVFDQPLDLPIVGKLWLEESTKEELLARWLRIVRTEKLAIREGLRVQRIDPREGGGFTVHAVGSENEEDDVQEFSTRRVLLAIGKRGSPRQLGADIDDDMADRVFYSLADARTFAGQRIVVVGLGDVAMEAAIALSRQPDTEVVVCYRGGDFSRGSARNIEELRRRVAAGAIDLRLHTTVRRVSSGHVSVSSSSGEVDIACDGLFVLIGTIPPIEFLTRAGVLPGSSQNADDKEIEG